MPARSQEHGGRKEDFIALASKNDPFYCGAPAQVRRAEWFMDLWERFGYVKGVHLRRVHYRITDNPEPIYRPDKLLYDNTDTNWTYLAECGKFARYLGYIDLDAFEDRRNPEPVVLVQNSYDPELSITSVDRVSIKLPIMPEFPEYGIEDFVADQAYLLEVWCEKTTMNDILLPFCRLNDLNLITAAGEISITAVKQFYDRVRDLGRPGRIFYISDFDPAGQSMPVAVSRKVEWMVHRYGRLNIKLFPLVLSKEQCTKYQLVHKPIAKESQKRRKAFTGQYGEVATELDALEAKVPGELANILRDAINPYIDDELEIQTDEVKADLQDECEERQRAVVDDHKSDIDKIQGMIDDINKDVGKRAEALAELANATWDSMEKALEGETPGIDDFPLPDPDPDGDQEIPLFDSQRSYMDQLRYYKQFQGRLEN